LNEVVAKKTRQTMKIMADELEGGLCKEVYGVEEVKIVEEQQEGEKKKKAPRDMARYAPLIFEECYVKHKGLNRAANTFELDADPDLSAKIDPTFDRNAQEGTQGLHLFVMCHGF